MRFFTLLAALSLSGCLSSLEIPQVEDPVGLPHQSKEDKSYPDCQTFRTSDFRNSGPFEIMREEIDGEVLIWKPLNKDLNCKYPIAHFGNGTGNQCETYTEIMTHLASYGFIVGCYRSPITGSGKQCIKALSLITDKYGSEILPRIGSVGHSQGGGGALACLSHLENNNGWESSYTATAVGIYPAHGMGWLNWRRAYPRIKSPVLLLSASRDKTVSKGWVKTGYKKLKAARPRYWLEARGAGHRNHSPWSTVATSAWLRWHLLGDRVAANYFKKLPRSIYWSLQAKK